MNRNIRLIFLPLILSFLAAAASATVTVNVSAPAATANVPTSFNIVASATTDASGARVTGWYIYDSGTAVWNTPSGTDTSSINAPLTLAVGTHTILVRAWDSTGAFGSQTLTLTASPCAGVCVTVSSPSATQNVPSPVRFTASAADGTGHAITGFVVYSDSTNVYQNHISTLDTWVILPAGSHSIYIHAWDSSGAFGTSATFPITVQGTVVPTPLAGAVTINNIDDDTTPSTSSRGWGSCGAATCAGGGADATTFPMTQNVSSPARDGASTNFTITGPAYADALWWNKLGAQDTKTNFLWDFWFYLPSSSTSAQAIEFDLWQTTAIAGTIKKFMFGTQCDHGHWDSWDQVAGHWVSQTSLPCSFSTNTWHHLIYFVQRIGDSRDTLLYGNVTLDGTTTQWNIQAPSQASSWGANMGVQYQLDIGGTGASLQEWIDQVTVTMW
jgi:hypothetical protein